jgi:hypothetical protein
MNPSFNAAHNAQVRNVNNDFAARRAANTFSRSLSARQGARSLGDMRQNFSRQVPQFQANFARRGLGSSGVYQKAMQRFTGDYSRDMGRMLEDQDADRYKFDMDDAGLVAERDRVLGDLDLSKAQQIAMTAQSINALRPFMG